MHRTQKKIVPGKSSTKYDLLSWENEGGLQGFHCESRIFSRYGSTYSLRLPDGVVGKATAQKNFIFLKIVPGKSSLFYDLCI